MLYCLVNKIKTPDGTVLNCEYRRNYKSYTDKLSGETYINDGLGYYVRRSINEVPYEDLSVWIDTENIVLTPEVRQAKFWGARKTNGEIWYKSLEEISDKHLCAILKTQTQIIGTPIEKLLEAEFNERGLK